MEEKRPVRRKDKDNPYSIFTDDGKYFVTFKDSTGITVTTEISEEVYTLFDRFELEDLARMNEMERHGTLFELNELEIFHNADSDCFPVDVTVSENIEYHALRKAIAELPEVQRRRIIMYFFDGLSYEEIAALEGCRYQAIQKSIRQSVRKLRRVLK
jgi:RNA polymerase sigma-70 factor (ECF subfamily)